MKKNKIDNVSKTIIFMFGVYFVIVLILFLPQYINTRGKLYIVTNSISIKYINGVWSNINDYKDYKLKEFNIYQDAEYMGKYQVVYSNKLLKLFENGKQVPYSGNILGYRGNLNLNIYNTELVENLSESDKFAINSALSKLDISGNSEVNYVEKKEIDVNNDGVLDYIYCINNFYVENDTNERFSIIFSIVNDNVNIIDKIITNKDGVEDSQILSIMNILDIRNDKKMELLYASNYCNGSSDSTCATLYNLYKNKVIKNFCK